MNGDAEEFFLPPTSVEITSLAQVYIDTVAHYGLSGRQARDAFTVLANARVAYRKTIADPEERADDEWLWDQFHDHVVDVYGGT